MSSFFDKKEEVLDIELTQYGKYLLSIGKFNPKFYAFYDEDILYDSEYAGYTELQNDIEGRILSETPFMKSQYVSYGIETNFSKVFESYRDYDKVPSFTPDTHERAYANTKPLGTSAFENSYSPSWNIKLLESEISSTSTGTTSSFENIRIPQINLSNPTYNIINKIGTPPSLEDVDNCLINPNDLPSYDGPDLSILNDEFITSPKFKDGTYLTFEQENIIIEVDETNSDFLNENFEIEIFEVEEELTTGEEKLIPLFFIKEESNIVDDILLDEKDYIVPVPTKRNVEYYFDVTTDNEETPDYWLSKGASSKNASTFYNLEEFKSKTKKISDIAVQGLYNATNIPEEEDC